MRHLRILIALTVVALTFTASPVAQADPDVNTTHLVDITIDCGDFTCTWTDIPVGGTPPGPVSVDASRSAGSCTNGWDCTLGTFMLVFSENTAMIDRLTFTCTAFGITCTYEATNVALSRNGTTKEYVGTFTAARVSGSIFICPSTRTGTISLVFH